MNLNEIKEMVKTTDREVEFTVEGKKTGWFLTLRHEADDEIQEFMRNHRAKVQDLMLKRRNSELKALNAKQEIGLRAKHVLGWRWEQGEDPENGRPAFSQKELKQALTDPVLGYHLGQFIDREVGSLEDFLEMSEND